MGAVSSCSSVLGAFEISEATLVANALTFKCTSRDGQRTLTLKGTVNADEISFTWEKEVRPGGNASPNDPMFGDAAPRRFVARRVAGAPDTIDAALMKVAAERSWTVPAVTFERIVRADAEPANWLTYSGNLQGHRHSPLTQITRDNIGDLQLAWLTQAPTTSRVEATPLIVDGVMYTTRNTNDVVALDAETGRVIWVYSHIPIAGARATGGGGRPNRGLAILGRTLFLSTLDAHLLAIDAVLGTLRWGAVVADARDPSCEGGPCYAMTLAPLVVKNKVIVGVGGGEGRTRGFVAAFDASTGKESWRFNTIPGPGEPGHNSWAGDSWKIGGVPVWTTGAFDPDLNLTYWGTGNPYPPWDGSTRAGDNLYSNSVVALDADTGKLRWHYQFTPHDVNDWDSAQTPVLVDLPWQGRPRKLMLWANRNGLLYVLDRTTGEFLLGKPFVEVNWTNGFDKAGRPLRVPNQTWSAANPIRPGSATNWNPHSYSPNTGWFYVAGWERGGLGDGFTRGKSFSAVRAFDPVSGERKWEFRLDDAVFWRGVMTTASDLLFTGTWGDFYSDPADARKVDGQFYALDARTGQILWRFGLASSIQSPPVTYSVKGKQYVAVQAEDTLFAFTLRR
jgi:alcohol dehydrogenase (cytochrome c)